MQEKNVDLFIGGVKERPIAYKLGIGFCDHNHERKEALAGFEGMLNFAREVHCSVMSPGVETGSARGANRTRGTSTQSRAHDWASIGRCTVRIQFSRYATTQSC